MVTNDIYHYTNPRQLLLDLVAKASSSSADFSVRKMAKKSGLSSHVPLVLLLQGKRKLHPNHAEWIARAFDFDPEGKNFFKLLILRERAKSVVDRDTLDAAIRKFRAAILAPSASELDDLEIIAHPIHSILLAGTQAASGCATLGQLCEKFSGLYTKAEMRAAVERLVRHGLLRFEGERPVSVHVATTVKNDRGLEATKNYHTEALRIAQEVLKVAAAEEREYQTLSLTVPTGKMSLAKAMIRTFTKDFERNIEAIPGDEVYQLSLQFFRLSDLPSLKRDSGAQSRYGTPTFDPAENQPQLRLAQS